MNHVIRYYTSRGVPEKLFDHVDGEPIPAITLPLTKEPAIKAVNDPFTPEIENQEFLESLLEHAKNRIRWESYMMHMDKFDGHTVTARPLLYSVRTAFAVCTDLEINGTTLRDIIWPHPFKDGKFDGINNYPYPKPTGASVLLADSTGDIILQLRTNLEYDGNTIGPSASGGVSWRDIKGNRSPKITVYKEANEEIMVPHYAFEEIKFIGLAQMIDHPLDIDFMYLAKLDTKVGEIHNWEVQRIIRVPAGIKTISDFYTEETIEQLKKHFDKYGIVMKSFLSLLEKKK